MRSATAVLLLISMVCFISCAEMRATPPPPATVCSVINEDFCFAIDQGDEATLNIPVDFALYKVLLANKQEVLIYYGTAPDYPDDSIEPVLSRVSGNETITLYKKSENGSNNLDAFYAKKSDKFTMVVHISSSYDASEKKAFSDFLSSFRKCDSVKKDHIECKAEKIFPDMAQFL